MEMTALSIRTPFPPQGHLQVDPPPISVLNPGPAGSKHRSPIPQIGSPSLETGGRPNLGMGMGCKSLSSVPVLL